MRKLLTVGCIVATALSLSAQSPLTTTFASNNSGSVGGAVYFDLTVNTGLAITGIDVNLNTAASTPGSIDIYTCAGSYSGNEANFAAWTLIGSGTVVSAGPGAPSTVTLSAPIPLAPGTAGYAYAGVGHSFAYTNGNGTNQTYSTVELTLNAGSATNAAFSGSPFTPRVVNTSIHYTGGSGNYASQNAFGEGCYDSFASFYETFVSSPIDLNGTSLLAIYTASGYLILPGGSQWYTPTSAPIPFNDDQVQTHALGWTLPYPGGTTTNLHISSNGFIYLTPNTNSGCCSGNTTNLLSSTYGPRWAGLWNDLNPGSSGGGSIYVDTDPTTGTCFVTFDSVPRYGTSDLNTFQYAFDQSGNVELRYASCNIRTSTTLIGWSPGAGNLDPGSTDLSAITSLVVGSNDRLALELTADARPVIGTSINLSIGNVPASAVLSAVIYGLSKIDPGLPLGAIGMTGCQQYCSQDSVALLMAPTTSVPFGIPNTNALSGVTIITQGACYDPAGGHNALGALSSNGVELLLDLN